MARSIAECIRLGREVLQSVSSSAALDTEILLEFCCGLNRTQLLTRPSQLLTPTQCEQFEQLLERRKNAEPIAYLIGQKEFYGRTFTVTPDVLCPRPETELIIELALERASTAQNFLDLGTGSGCLAVSLVLEFLSARNALRGLAIDQSSAALAVAKKNAQSLQCAESIVFLESDWFCAVQEQEFDLIVANPPYVAQGQGYSKELAYEPASALYAGEYGLDALRVIVPEAPAYLAPHGLMLVEIGSDQGAAACAIAQEAFQGQRAISLVKDLAGHDRILVIGDP